MELANVISVNVNTIAIIAGTIIGVYIASKK